MKQHWQEIRGGMDMKVWKRVLIKSVIFLLIVAVAGGGAASFRAYRQSTPEYAADKYMTCLIENDAKKAYVLLDQSEDKLTQKEYEAALKAKKYSLYSSFKMDEQEKRRDNEGNEFIDYRVKFLDAAGETKAEEEFTVRRQDKAVLGIFDTWKVMARHCMIKDFQITVPTGAQLYLNNVKADAGWIVRDGVSPSYDCYEIPSLLPGEISVTVRHAAFESVNTTLDTSEKSVDYTEKMTLKTSAQDTCKELAVKALKQLYAAAAKNEKEASGEIFDTCKKDAKKFVKNQGSTLHQEGRVFKNAGISDFTAQFKDAVFTENEDGAIEVEMTFSYHYVVREDVMEDTGEVLEDGTPVQQEHTGERSGDNMAKFVMSFADGAWKIVSLEVPVIPHSE